MVASQELRRDVLFSIHPNYAELIVQGEKTVELRRRFSDHLSPGAFALIYCTSPVQAIIGVATIKEVKRLSVKTIWSKYSSAARVERNYFDEYFAGKDEGYAIVFKSARRFTNQIEASKLRKRFGFVAPQSFVYLPIKYYKLFENEQ